MLRAVMRDACSIPAPNAEAAGGRQLSLSCCRSVQQSCALRTEDSWAHAPNASTYRVITDSIPVRHPSCSVPSAQLCRQLQQLATHFPLQNPKICKEHTAEWAAQEHQF